MVSPDDLRKLRQHHDATIGLFVAFWLYVIVAIGVIEFVEISEDTQKNLIGVLFGAAIVLSLLQFVKRCPNCRANLGCQVKLGIPRICRKCGAALREQDADS
jgi:hypothetical protein